MVRSSMVRSPLGTRSGMGLVMTTAVTMVVTVSEVVVAPRLSVATAVSRLVPGKKLTVRL